jgi:predicted membrane channel-forming protein YqfA (hemolysin III family)
LAFWSSRGSLALAVAATIDGKASKLTAIMVYTGRLIAMLGSSAAYSLLNRAAGGTFCGGLTNQRSSL